MNKLIEKSIKHTIVRNVGSVLLTILCILSGICTILGISLRDYSPLWFTIVSFLIVLSISYFFFHQVLKRIDKYITLKEERIKNQQDRITSLLDKIDNNKDYFSFMNNLSDSFSAINKMVRSGKISGSLFQQEMLTFCNKLRESFEVLNNVNSSKDKAIYSVSIKIVISDTDITDNKKVNEIEVMNSFRDTSSFQDSSRNDEVYCTTHHFVADNTAYKSIVELIFAKSKYCYYINNDVEKDKNYKSSSQSCYIYNKIPYRSEFVMPILSISQVPLSKNLLGFLCITCNQSNGFALNDKEIRLMLSIADNLFNIISKWQKKQISTDYVGNQDILNPASPMKQIESRSQEKTEQL